MSVGRNVLVCLSVRYTYTLFCFVSLGPLYIGLLDMSVGTLAHRGTALSVHLSEATFIHYNVSRFLLTAKCSFV